MYFIRKCSSTSCSGRTLPDCCLMKCILLELSATGDQWTRCQCRKLTPDWRSLSVCVRMMLKTACDRLLSSFMLVAATVRDLLPSDIRDSMSYKRWGNHMITTWLQFFTPSRPRQVLYLVAGNSQTWQAVHVRAQNFVLPHPQRLPATK